MKLSKVMKQRIHDISVAERHLYEYERTVRQNPVSWWSEIPFDEWNEEQGALFDLVNRIEADLKTRIIRKLTGNPYEV